VLFVEGQDGELLCSKARTIACPYRLLHRPEQGLYLLEVWAYPPELEALALGWPGVRCWSFELLEEGCLREQG